MSEQVGGKVDERGREEDREHLRDLEEGAGCTEIWEHLSERREED